ncbi:TonB-dependent receptor [Aequorivita antarctica]|uniref:TonB-dependent receptor n=1 Tax=Aequorivita antarctica TaxID=153266 RepID=A0A5C6YZS8_9FLAO|nr:TonB-dependent receptor [Aequorivita antarctica]TXD73273.1 TonB-dependent receptor [Aequorivita antarctica]SRX76026.1 TonB-dependent receptor SusC [Aequorivita antarctica]
MKIKLLLITLLLVSFISLSQEKHTLSGTIKDGKSTETLIGVNIYIPELEVGTSTNEYGFYSLTIPTGVYTLDISYLGFQPYTERISLNQNTKKDISILEESESLDEVLITETKKRTDIKKAEMSSNKLSVQTIKQMPVVLGEVDIIKSILQLPGVTNAGEGQSGFNVRGGSADQNLILLDEASIYNASHLFGFFSVFNSDAIKDMKLYKGGIPARYGGRLSSVLDIYQKDGNNETYNFSGGIGIISSRLMAEGPLQKERGSFLLAGRASYGHLFLKLSDNKNSASFYDLNTKFNYKLDENNTLFLSGYFGRDLLNLSNIFTNTYGNTTANLRWNHLFSDKLFSNASFIYSDYYYGLELEVLGFKWDSGIQNFNFKYDFKHYFGNATKLSYGINAQYYIFNPGTINPLGENSGVNPRQLSKKYAFEPAIYIEAEQKLSEKIEVNYGLRYGLFYRLGKQDINIYQNNQAVVFNPEFQIYEKADPIGVKSYDKNETIASFNNLEPRIAVSYALNDDQSVKASYNRMVQYLHLISNTQSPTPLDIWAPSDEFLKPQFLDQVALGYYRNFSDDNYSLEVETFYKKIKNRVDYIDGAELIGNDAIEQVVLNGEVRSYGLEMMLRKNSGKLTGWVAYTLSRSEQRTPGRTASETGINDGNWYKSGYDKLHNLAITATYKKSEKWSFGSVFNLQSGRAATFPKGQYEYQGIIIPSFGARNMNNLPAYHHLDISATYTPKPNKTEGWRSEWVFGIYNIYNQKNAASIDFRQNIDTGENEAVKFSIFGVVPSITYNFKF